MSSLKTISLNACSICAAVNVCRDAGNVPLRFLINAPVFESTTSQVISKRGIEAVTLPFLVIEKFLRSAMILLYVFVTFKLINTLVQELAESTLNLRIFPAVMEVVHPVNVVSCDFIAVESVGFADAGIVSAIVGG